MEFGELAFGSPRYAQALDLRYRILRVPLGLEWTEAEIAWEPKERHFALLEEGQVVAVVVARDLGAGRCKLRQMAVEPERQGSGLGRELLDGVDAWLAADEVKMIELNARDHAVGFYEKQGYRKVGEEFIEVGIPHWKMEKAL